MNYKYIGGGWFRDASVPKGQRASMLHGDEMLAYADQRAQTTVAYEDGYRHGVNTALEKAANWFEAYWNNEEGGGFEAASAIRSLKEKL